jgi:hypothetical protein
LFFPSDISHAFDKLKNPQSLILELPFRIVQHNNNNNNAVKNKILRVVKPRRMRWARPVARKGEGSGVYRFWVGKPEGKRPLGRLRRRWEDNTNMDLQEVGCQSMDWIGTRGGHL